MHSVLAQRAQPPEKSGYPLFLAEIASTTNEVLLTDHMLKTAASREERLFVLSQVLERLRAAFFRQTMFAEFELLAHDAQQRGEALSGKRFTEMYCGLLRRYHGAAEGVMTIDPVVCHEWAFIPHFHRPFYVYAYATSTTAAQFFGERILAGAPGAREAYLDVLRAGGSMPPHEALLRAGLDLTSPEPYRALVRRMNAVLDEVERLL
jgi:oligoendopeptidase F